MGHKAVRADEERPLLAEPIERVAPRPTAPLLAARDTQAPLAGAAEARLPTSASVAGSVGRVQRSPIIRRELDPALREGLIRQRGAARGIDARSATRDVERSAGTRPAAPAPDLEAQAAAQAEAQRRAAERAELQARFDLPENVEKRRQRAAAAEQQRAADEAAAAAKGEEQGAWEQTVKQQYADRDAILERRETLVLEGLDDALLLDYPELRAAAAEVLRATSALDIAAARRAIEVAERCFGDVRELVEDIDELRGRFGALGPIGTRKQRLAQSVRDGLAERSTKPWAEFARQLPQLEASIASLEGTQQRREQQEGAAGERQLAEQADAEFRADPKKETLKAQLDKGLIARGEVTRTYRSSWDNQPGEFSVEVTVHRVKSIVIHAHCEPDGTPKSGNGTHWKYFTERKLPGKSHSLSNELITALVDKKAAKSHRDKNPALKDT